MQEPGREGGGYILIKEEKKLRKKFTHAQRIPDRSGVLLGAESL